MKPLLDSLDFEIDEETFCWNVTGKKTSQGYKTICRAINGKPTTLYAHRIAYEWGNGPIAEGDVVCHECDNPSCINPTHLFAAPERINAHDMLHKERGHGLLTKEQLTYIVLKRDWRVGDVNFLAKMFGVKANVITRAKKPTGCVWLRKELGVPYDDSNYEDDSKHEEMKARRKRSYRQKHGPKKDPKPLTTYYQKVREKRHDEITEEEREAMRVATARVMQKMRDRHAKDPEALRAYREKKVIEGRAWRKKKMEEDPHFFEVRKPARRLSRKNWLANLRHTNPVAYKNMLERAKKANKKCRDKKKAAEQQQKEQANEQP